LIQAAKEGSSEALGSLLEASQAYLLQVARARLGPELRAKGEASDLVQETFLEAQHDFACFRGCTGQDLIAWLRRILHHNLADFRRRYRARTSRGVNHEQPFGTGDVMDQCLGLIADTNTPEKIAAAAEEAESLRRALERLPQDYRRVVLLRHHEGHSFPMIGRELGRSAGAARKLWFRAVERLRSELRTAGAVSSHRIQRRTGF
jgi:RNA polymerase sigma-70 factor (ECF subfamily)